MGYSMRLELIHVCSLNGFYLIMLFYEYWFICLLFKIARSPGGNTPQDTNCTATCPLSRKLFKLDEPDMQDTAGEAETNS